ADEATVSNVNINAELAESLRRVVLADFGAEFPHPLHRSSKGNLRFTSEMNPELRPVARVIYSSRRANEGLGWYAADIKTISTHQIALDEGYFRAQSSGARRTDQTRRPSANDDQLVLSG